MQYYLLFYVIVDSKNVNSPFCATSNNVEDILTDY